MQISHIPSAPNTHSLPHCQHLPPEGDVWFISFCFVFLSGMFVVTDEHTLIPRYHPKFGGLGVYVGGDLWLSIMCIICTHWF